MLLSSVLNLMFEPIVYCPMLKWIAREFYSA